MDDLDRIPWKDLTHAYGSAEDVPDLLRQLSAPSNANDGDSALSELFTNIHHQGTVYEATPYAVPFLLKLVSDARTHDRIGILGLLANIARGSSYCDVHGNFLQRADFEDQKNRELAWVAQSHAAVAAGFETLVEITKEPTEIRLAASHVLAQLHEYAGEVSSLIRQFLSQEVRDSYRAGWLLLLGQTGDRTEPTVAVLSNMVQATDARTRHAAACAIVRLKLEPLPAGAREAIMDALKVDNLVKSFLDLPFYAGRDINDSELLAALSVSKRELIADQLIEAIESKNFTAEMVWKLLDMQFRFNPKSLPFAACDLSPRQRRAVLAMFAAMEPGKPIFHGHFPHWGLPDTMREWRDLAAGRQPIPVDLTLPLIATPDDPRQGLRRDQLSVGQRIVHRNYGLGTVTNVDNLTTVLFDEEGEMELGLD